MDNNYPGYNYYNPGYYNTNNYYPGIPDTTLPPPGFIHNSGSPIQESTPSIEEHALLVDNFLKNISSDSQRSRSHSQPKSDSSPENKDDSSTSKKEKKSPKRESSSAKRKKSSEADSSKHDPSETGETKSRSKEKKSKQSSRLLEAKYKDELSKLKKKHEKDLTYYIKNPKAHSRYAIERKIWFSSKKQELIQGRTPPTEIEKLWQQFWTKLLEETHKHEWKVKKRKFLASREKTDESSTKSKDQDDSRRSKSPSRDKKEKSTKKNKNNHHSKDGTGDKLNGRSRKSDAEAVQGNSPKELPDSLAGSQQNSELCLKKLQISEEAFYVVKVLKQLGSLLGFYEDAITHLYMQFSEERSKGTNLADFIDQDTEIFFTVIKGKLESCIKSENVTVMQKAIYQEALDRVVGFTNHLTESKKNVTLDIRKIAESTKGKSCAETLAFIKDVLHFKNIVLVDERLMQLYLAITTLQAKSLSGNISEDSVADYTFTITPQDKVPSSPSDESVPVQVSSSTSLNSSKRISHNSSPGEKDTVERKFVMTMKGSSVNCPLKSKVVSQLFDDELSFSDNE